MKYSFLILGFLISFHTQTHAQQSNVTFQSKDLQLISQRYTGSTANWPLVIEVATHNISENSFTLEAADVLQLQNFATFSMLVNEQKTRISQLINNGATVFATEQYAVVKDIINKHYAAVDEGQLEAAITHAQNLLDEVDLLETTLMENRVVDVQAQLSKRKGQVDKKAGLLGSWTDAFLGDLFKQADGIRTMIESYATLSFTDGSDIQINPNTVAVIRKSRIDKLNDASDTEITLEDGGLLAKLSSAGKQKSTFVLNAGPSRTELKTQNFYAEADGPEMAKLSNYDGEAIINSNNVTISIQKNEGTIVEEGKDPLQPVKLLPAPTLTWLSADTVINKENLFFSYLDIEGAVSYKVQYSSSPNFDQQLTEVTTSETTINIPNLPLGMTYVRVQATDQLGLRGPYSKTARIIRTTDNKPPPVFVDNMNDNIILTTQENLALEGVTEPDAILTINGNKASVFSSGRFSYPLSDLSGETELKLISKDPSGNQSETTLTVVRLTEDVLFDFNIGRQSALTTTVVSEGSTTFSATAYPGLKITITNQQQTRTIVTDKEGRWGTKISLIPGDLTISFDDISTEQTFISKSFKVEGI
jgi:hypothetical protein